MAQVASPHIWYPDGYPGSAYDLRQIVTWNPKTDANQIAQVRFVGDPVAVTDFDMADFEAAKQNSLDNGG